MTESYQLTEKDGVFRLTLFGRLTYNDHNEMKKVIQFFKEVQSKRVVIDMSRLTFIDSSAIGILLILAEELRKFDGVMAIDNPQGQVARVLTVAKILDLFLTPKVALESAINEPDLSGAGKQIIDSKDFVKTLVSQH